MPRDIGSLWSKTEVNSAASILLGECRDGMPIGRLLWETLQITPGSYAGRAVFTADLQCHGRCRRQRVATKIGNRMEITPIIISVYISKMMLRTLIMTAITIKIAIIH